MDDTLTNTYAHDSNGNQITKTQTGGVTLLCLLVMTDNFRAPKSS